MSFFKIWLVSFWIYMQISIFVLVKTRIQWNKANFRILNHTNLAIWVWGYEIILVFVPVDNNLIISIINFLHILVNRHKLCRQFFCVFGCIKAWIHVWPIDCMTDIYWCVQVWLWISGYRDLFLIHNDLMFLLGM